MNANKNNRVTLVLCFDDGMARHAAATLSSSARNLRPGWMIDAYVITFGLTDEHYQRLQNVVSRYDNLELTLMSPITQGYEQLPHAAWVSSSANLRVEIPYHFADYERVLYLDADTLVCADLVELWEKSMESAAVMACQDTAVSRAERNISMLTFLKFGMNKKTPCFNSGVLLIQPQAWLEKDIAQRYHDLLQDYGDAFVCCDQDALNILLFDSVGFLDPAWNMDTFRFYLKEMYPDMEERTTKIVHFVSSPKPDHPGCVHPCYRWFVDELDKSGWFSPEEFHRFHEELERQRNTKEFRRLRKQTINEEIMGVLGNTKSKASSYHNTTRRKKVSCRFK